MLKIRRKKNQPEGLRLDLDFVWHFVCFLVRIVYSQRDLIDEIITTIIIIIYDKIFKKKR